VRFVSENYGDSELARRFGVTRYPAIFVDSVLVATPKDFGFYGKGEGANSGRYAPLRSADAHARFRADLARMIDLLLAGRTEEARAGAADASEDAIANLPAIDLAALAGAGAAGRDAAARITNASLAGKVVLVEFWATWCPPCRGTLRWLGDLERRYGDRLEVVAIAVESDSAAVAKIAADPALPLRFALGTPELARAFGDISAVPTLFLFDAQGRRATSAFGAPPDLHAKIEARLSALAGAPDEAKSPSQN
jgi:thiol-disulfide isomerase/thioredoxin